MWSRQVGWLGSQMQKGMHEAHQPPPDVFTPGDARREMRLALDPWEGCRLEAIAHLPEALRTAMILFNLEGFSTEEIARLAGVRPPAIDSLLVRGRELVRDDLLECLRKLT